MNLVRREALLLVKANGRLVDCTAWRTWTRSTWKVDMVPADVERRGRGRGGAAANGRLATAAGPGQLTLPDAVPPPDLPSATILSDRPRPRP